MLKFATYFSLAFLILGLYGSEAEVKGEGRSVCLLHDPPNQCGEFCLEALKPMLDHIAFHQKKWIACGTQNETQAKLDKIEDYLLKLQESLDPPPEFYRGPGSTTSKLDSTAAGFISKPVSSLPPAGAGGGGHGGSHISSLHESLSEAYDKWKLGGNIQDRISVGESRE